MKNGLTIAVLFIACSVQAIAQDIIWKKTGEKIEAKVIKITDEEIEYKKYDNLSGPVYSIESYSIIQITFENGEIEKINASNKQVNSPAPSYSQNRHDDNLNSPNSEPNIIEEDAGAFYAENRKIGRRTLESWLRKLNDPESRALYDKSVRMRKFAYYFIGGAGGVGLVALYGELMLETGGYILAVGTPIAVAMLVTNVILINQYKVVQSNAIEKYNEALKLTNKYEEKE